MRIEKKELQAKFNRDLIILAAEKLFVEKGFEKTLINDIALLSGYSKSTVYVYFKSKDDIYNHIILKGMRILKSEIHKLFDMKSNFNVIYKKICLSIVRFQARYPVHFEGVLGQINVDFTKNDENCILYQIYKTGEEIIALLSNFVNSLIKEGMIRKDIKVKETILIYWASISSLVRIAVEKEDYINHVLGQTKKEFMDYGFNLLLDAVKK